MYNDNIAAWVEQMRTTHEKQGKSHLCVIEWDPRTQQEYKAYCCLGLGSKDLADVTVEVVRPDWLDDSAPDAYAEESYATFNEQSDLAPIEFRVWLGVLDEADTSSANPEVDVYLDIPEEVAELRYQGPRPSNLRDITTPPFYQNLYRDLFTAANLNDNGFTFAQIADCVAYFGLKKE